MEKKYKILRIVASLYKVLAWIMAVLGVIAALALLVLGIIGGGTARTYGFGPGLYGLAPFLGLASPVLSGVVGFLVVLISTAFCFALLYGVADLIHLGLAIEENTRESAYYLRGEGALPPHV